MFALFLLWSVVGIERFGGRAVFKLLAALGLLLNMF
jgi:hypothetical protein